MAQDFNDPDFEGAPLDKPSEEASMWLARINRGLRHEEVAELRDWLRIPRHRHAILDMARLWHQPDIIAVLCEVFPEGPEPMQPEFWRAFASIALRALVVVGLIVLAFTGEQPLARIHYLWAKLLGSGDVVEAPLPRTLLAQGVYSTGVGERREIPLPDDSTVTLNTGTRVSVVYSAREREIVLPYGEASFHVTHDESRPFFVHAGTRRFQAVGTNFNVRVLTPENVSLTVTEGNVRVLYTRDSVPDTPAAARLQDNMTYDDTTVGALQTALVEPGLQFVRKVEASDIDALLAWQQGLIFFKAEPLESALAEVDRYTNTRFVFADERLRAVRIAGQFHTGNIEEFLISLRKDFGVDSWRDPQGHIVLAALVCGPGAVGAAGAVGARPSLVVAPALAPKT